jgi:lipopolysaccharide transport system ATP-binding protein
MTNSDDVLIKVENVSKKFCRSLKRSMLYGIEDISRDLLHLPNTSDKLRGDEFWAVDDVSFEVKRGECLGIIGRNGAGKSTLLKMLNGIILPDKGKITIKGKVGALIEVGAGFHPMLTGRENIYVNGAILGMSKREIDKKFDEIVAFAELEEFIDMPVKHYSSGMYVRLGFAIASQLKPEILIIDEVLAVGDMKFAAKCLRFFSQAKYSSAIILVSHDMRNISRSCDNAFYINKGRAIKYGKTQKVIECYQYNNAVIYEADLIVNQSILSDEIKQLEVNCERCIQQFTQLNIKINISIYRPLELVFSLAIYREDGTHCCGLFSMFDNQKKIYLKKRENIIEVNLNDLQLMPANYVISIGVWKEDCTALLAINERCCSFTVLGSEVTHGVYMPINKWNHRND